MRRLQVAHENGFAWKDPSGHCFGQYMTFHLASYATAKVIALKFPVGERYKFSITTYAATGSSKEGITRLVGISCNGDLLTSRVEVRRVAQSFLRP